ncbi:TPA: hypothetical protein ACS70C_002857 [Providencia alcalifaciens]
MGEYLVRRFPSSPTREAALNSAIKQIKLSRQGKPKNINASGKQREATKVWQSNLAMSKFFPPLPVHIEQQRIVEDLMRYARYIAKGIAPDNYGYGEGRNMGD